MLINKYFKKNVKNLYLISLFLIIGFNFILRIIFIFYGYISTEEGTLLLNQELAYSGKVPFLDYDAWNSLLNDYFIGWHQLLITPSILSQRFIGLILVIIVLILTLKIASNLGGKLLTIFTALFITFGSYTYLYISNIPYSAQVTTLLMMISLLFLSINIRNKNLSTINNIFSLLFMTAAAVNLIQALPGLLLLYVYLLFVYKLNIKKLIQISIPSLIFVLIVVSAFSNNIDNLIYSLTWPFYADKILIYQVNSNVTFSNILSFFQELIRDYFVFVCFITAGVFTRLIPLNNQIKFRLNKNYFLFLLFSIGLSFVLTGLIHKPPYASYVNIAIPILSLLAAWTIFKFMQIITTKTIRIYFFIVICFMLFNNFLNYTHYKVMKTSWSTIDKTPHYYLNQVTEIIRNNSLSNDKILSFYTPIVAQSGRHAIDNFNRDRFSMSLFDSEKAKKYNLINNSMLVDLILAKEAKIIAFSDKNIKYFGIGQEEQQSVLKAIDNNYILIEKYNDLNKIEDPKDEGLYIYIRR